MNGRELEKLAHRLVEPDLGDMQLRWRTEQFTGELDEANWVAWLWVTIRLALRIGWTKPDSQRFMDIFERFYRKSP